MLDQHTNEPFQGSHQGTVDHDWLMFGAVNAGITHLKPLGQIEVDLNGGALPGTSQLILDLDIDLGPVKDTLARVDLILQLLFSPGPASAWVESCQCSSEPTYFSGRVDR